MATRALGRTRTDAGTRRLALLLPLAFAAMLLVPLLLSLPFLSEPMEQDEGVYFAVARSGDLPYVSVFDHKPPLVYAWYAGALALSGGETSVEAVRLLAALNIGLAALGVFWTASVLLSRRIAFIAAALTAVAPLNQYLQFNANTEVFMLAPLIFSAGAFVRGWQSRSLGWFALAGALAGIATMTKSVGVLHLGLLVLLPAWGAATGVFSRREAASAAAVTAACGLLVVGAVAAPFVAGGHGAEFWHANVTYNLAYSAEVPLESKLFALGSVDEQIIVGALPLWGLAAGGLVLLGLRGASLASGLLIGGLAAALAGASATGREYPHYWVPLVPYAAVFAAVALDRLFEAWSSTRARLHAEALLLALAIPAIFAVVPLYLVGAEDAHLRKYKDGLNAQRAVDNEELAARIRALTVPGDAIFVFGNDAQLYGLAERDVAGYYPRAVSAIATDDEAWDRITSELDAAPPALVVDSARVELTSAMHGLAPQPVELDVDPKVRAWVDAFLAAHYRRDRHVAYADVWVLDAEP